MFTFLLRLICSRMPSEGGRKFPLTLAMLTVLVFLVPAEALGQIELLQIEGEDGSTQSLSLTIQVLLLMTVLSLLPSILLMFTSFTRIVIVLAILRQAIGAGTTPSNQILIGLALFLTLFVMMPVAKEIHTTAYQPYVEESMTLYQAGEAAMAPLHEFMRGQVRESDVALFASLAQYEDRFESPADIPFSVLVPAFLTSELKTAFQIGFLVFLPFVIIDLAVASVLMSMGMIMLSPMLVSLPLKLMLFVLVDGWALMVGTLASSFG